MVSARVHDARVGGGVSILRWWMDGRKENDSIGPVSDASISWGGYTKTNLTYTYRYHWVVRRT